MSGGLRGAALLLVLVGAGTVLGGEAPRPAPARLTITSPRGGQTEQRVVRIQGTVTGVTAERLTLVLNGVPLSIPRQGDRFETEQVLAPGPNALRVRAETREGPVEDQVAVFARVPAKDLRVTLTWDTPGTDVDLWVTGPDGEKVFYGHRAGKAGGTLDTDVTTGFGPETYTQARAAKGTLRVQAHAYRIDRPTRVELTTVRFEGTPDEDRRTFRAVLLRTGDVVEVGEVVTP